MRRAGLHRRASSAWLALAPALLRLRQQRLDGELLCPIRQIAGLDLIDGPTHPIRTYVWISFPSFGFHAAFEEATRIVNICLNRIDAVDRITHWRPSAAA